MKTCCYCNVETDEPFCPRCHDYKSLVDEDKPSRRDFHPSPAKLKACEFCGAEKRLTANLCDDCWDARVEPHYMREFRSMFGRGDAIWWMFREPLKKEVTLPRPDEHGLLACHKCGERKPVIDMYETDCCEDCCDEDPTP